MKCPPNSIPYEVITSNINPTLKRNPNTNANPKLKNWWFTLRPNGTLSTEGSLKCYGGWIWKHKGKSTNVF